MIAGRLDRRVTISRPNPVTQDSHGGRVESFQNVATVYASVTHLKGREHLVGGQYTPEAEVKFRIRYRSDFTVSWRITHDSVTYKVLHVAEIGRRVGLEIMAKRP